MAMAALPPDVSVYRRTPTFDQDSVPAGLLDAHSTKAGVWGRIVVLSGHLRYELMDGAAFDLTPEQPGIIEAEVLHHVSPSGAVTFYVEFLR